MTREATRTYQRRLAAIRTETGRKAAAKWDDLDGYDEENVAPFVRTVTPLITAGQLLAAGLTNAFIARSTNSNTVKLAADFMIGSAVRNGTSLDEVYRRPFSLVWKQRGEGVADDEAVRAGRLSLLALANTDVWLATRAASAFIDRLKPQITSWVRVADPDACEECAAADGMPMAAAAELAGHPNCGCTSDPVVGETDSQAADPEAITVEHDDELGPMLRPAP